jgi:hypothetical protein
MASLLRRGPPTLAQDVQELVFLEGAGVCLATAIGGALAAVQWQVDEGTPIPSFVGHFEQLQQLQQSNADLCAQMAKQALAVEIMVANSQEHNPKELKEDFTLCLQFSRGCNLRLKELLGWLDARRTEDASSIVTCLNTRFETELGDRRLLQEMQSCRTTLEGLSGKIDTLQTGGEPLDPPVWEVRAQIVRQELMQAASLKSALSESTTRSEKKTRELFAAQKLVRDTQAKVEVLNSKMRMLTSKGSEVDELRDSVARLSKKEKESDQIKRNLEEDLEKVSKLNSGLRKKIVKHKYELKRQQDTRAMPAVGARATVTTVTGKQLTSLQSAADEINLMIRTIAAMREQMGTVRARQALGELQADLPPLAPVKRLAVHTGSLHDGHANVAAEYQRAYTTSPFALGSDTVQQDLVQVGSLRQELFQLSHRVSKFRTAPALVDLSKVGSAAMQQWLAKQQQAGSLQSETSALHAKLAGFLSAQQHQAFRSLFCAVPACGEVVAGGAASQSTIGAQLVGKLVLPGATSTVGQGCKVVLRPRQFANLHSVFAI